MNIDIIDYSIYGNRIDDLSDALIRSSAERLGFQATLSGTAKNSTSRQCSPFLWFRYDLRSRDDLALIHDLAISFEAQGCRVFPPPYSMILAEDKWETFTTLRSAHVPTVDTFGLDNVACESPFVIKPRVGWGGRGIRLIADPKELDDIPCEDKDSFICQPYIAHDRTFTVAVAGGVVIATLRTDSRGDDFRSNCSEGAPPEIVECPPAMASLATRTLQVMGLVAGTIDIIENNDACFTLEVNSAPRLSYETLPGLDLASPMAESIAAWLRREL